MTVVLHYTIGWVFYLSHELELHAVYAQKGEIVAHYNDKLFYG